VDQEDVDEDYNDDKDSDFPVEFQGKKVAEETEPNGFGEFVLHECIFTSLFFKRKFTFTRLHRLSILFVILLGEFTLIGNFLVDEGARGVPWIVMIFIADLIMIPIALVLTIIFRCKRE
jgi:hypothetical protein